MLIRKETWGEVSLGSWSEQTWRELAFNVHWHLISPGKGSELHDTGGGDGGDGGGSGRELDLAQKIILDNPPSWGRGIRVASSVSPS